MIANLIAWSVRNRLLVIVFTLFLTVWGLISLAKTPIDALPDLSDVQVIIRTTYTGQAPQIVENQVTYPLATTMLSVPGAKTVRGYSFFGDSFVYVLFEDGTDLYWARSRVLEYLNQIQGRLPASAKSSLGPDATGLGWIFQYALIDRSGKMDLSQLRALQDWFLKYELKSLPNVAEVATIGGMVKQYQVVLQPEKLAAYSLSQNQIIDAIKKSNNETGGGVLELGETEFMVRASGYLKTLDDFNAVPIKVVNGIPVRLGDVAHVQLGPEMRRGIGELNGEGEAVGAIVILRSGKNALETISAVKQKLEQLKSSLPAGVEIIPTYDRSELIQRAIHTLSGKLLEEFSVVALVCGLFLWHFRSALVAIISLPLGVLFAFIVMQHQGINANIMSLGGIAIAIGAMVDAALVMIENAHKHLEAWQHDHPDTALTNNDRWQLIISAAQEVGPALFFSLMIITLSFIPVFTLEAQEGKLFAPLAFTKTYAMAGAAGLSVTLIPILMGYLIRGSVPVENKNPLNRTLIALYRPLLSVSLGHPKSTLLIAAFCFLSALWPLSKIGGEFMPPLDEGDVLYMPTALPGLSAAKAAELLQQTDRMIKTVPEVASVYGKAGRAETATDPAPLEMFETTVQLKPRSAWRAGMTTEKLIEELDHAVKVPGLSNIWVPPIRNRIDMLATGIKSPIGIKVSGTQLADIEKITQDIERVAKAVPGVSSALAERLTGGRYIDIDINRTVAGRYGLSIEDIQSVIASSIGGENIGETIEGLARFPINVRYPRELRNSLTALNNLLIVSPSGQQITLGTVATIKLSDGPPMIKSENARPSGWVYIDVRGRDLASVVADLRKVIAQEIKLPASMSIAISGQFEYLERAEAHLKIVVPMTVMIIFILLYITFKSIGESLLIMFSLPFALSGGIWFLYLMHFNLSVATGVGFIALAGVSAEFGVVMLIYLQHAWDKKLREGKNTHADFIEAIKEGAVLRVRPKAMTVAVILAGLIPILIGDGTGSEVMSRIAAPMLGGMITAPLLSMFVIPAAWRLMPKNKKIPR